MKLRTVIIDDEPIALDKLRSYVKKTPYLELAGVFSNGIEALEMLSTDVDVDVIFTDISMPDINGMEMVKAMKKPPMIVFITAYSDYAAESYSVSAVDYLLKPYSMADFQRAASKVLERHSDKAQMENQTSGGEDKSTIFIKTDYRYVRINISDIRYIKGYGEYLQVFVEGTENPILTLSSFASLRDKLPGSFVQVHRSYIVNMNHVGHIERGRIVMDTDTYIPVGDSYKAQLQTYLTSNSIGGSSRKD